MRSAAAIGLSTIDEASGRVLDAWYPTPALGARPGAADGLPSGERADPLRGVVTVPVTTVVDDLGQPPVRLTLGHLGFQDRAERFDGLK